MPATMSGPCERSPAPPAANARATSTVVTQYPIVRAFIRASVCSSDAPSCTPGPPNRCVNNGKHLLLFRPNEGSRRNLGAAGLFLHRRRQVALQSCGAPGRAAGHRESALAAARRTPGRASPPTDHPQPGAHRRRRGALPPRAHRARRGEPRGGQRAPHRYRHSRRSPPCSATSRGSIRTCACKFISPRDTWTCFATATTWPSAPAATSSRGSWRERWCAGAWSRWPPPRTWRSTERRGRAKICGSTAASWGSPGVRFRRRTGPSERTASCTWRVRSSPTRSPCSRTPR